MLFFSCQKRIYFLETSSAIKAEPLFPIITTRFKFGIRITRDKLCQATIGVRTSTHAGCSQVSKRCSSKVTEVLSPGFHSALLLSCLPVSSILSLFLLGLRRRWLAPTDSQGNQLLCQVNFRVYWGYALSWKWAMPFWCGVGQFDYISITNDCDNGRMGWETSEWVQISSSVGDDLSFSHHRSVLWSI